MRDHRSLRRAAACFVWVLWAAVEATSLGGQEVDPSAYEHLVEPRIVERADERVLEVGAVGDPDDVGSAAFGLLFQLYFSSGAATGFVPPVARARWQERLDEMPRSEWVGRYALPVTEAVESLPEHTPPDGVTASITTWEYGTVAEILHIGRYDAEQPTIERLKAFVEAEGYETFGGHEEEYIVGPTMAGPGNPDEYRTILRYRIRKASPLRGRPVALGAQERGMLMERGAWQAPNPGTALQALMDQTPGSTAAVERLGHHAAVAVLRQSFEQRSASELDAFAGDLLQLMRVGTWWQQMDARMALVAAADEHGAGVPYTGAVDAFVQFYESFADRASEDAKAALGAMFDAGGVEQVRDVFEASEQPPACVLTQRQRPLLDPEGNVRRDANGDVMYEPPPENRCPNPPSTWCNAGFLLLYGDESGPLRGAPDQDLYRRLCEWGVTISGG